MRVPYFPERLLAIAANQIYMKTYAEKSAEAVAASEASEESLACQTAPLWPKKVPIQSPVTPSRSMGLPSLHAEMM